MITQHEFCSIYNMPVSEVEDWDASKELASKIVQQLPDTSGMNASDRLKVFFDSMKLLEIRIVNGTYTENIAFIAMLVAKHIFKPYERCFLQWEIKVLQGRMSLGNQPLLASRFMQRLHK